MTTLVKPTNTDTPTRRRFTRDEYLRAAESGVFGPEERLELIDGEVVEKMSPQKSNHSTGVCLLQEALREPFGSGFFLRVQLPLAVNSISELEPDIAMVKGKPRSYRDAQPTTAALIVEVADTSLEFDRTVKGPLYASAGVPEYWVLNLADRVLEVYREPHQAEDTFAYGSVAVLTESESVTPLSATSAIEVCDLLP